MNSENFKSVKEMINWLIDNQGTPLKDGCGREWIYDNYSFFFKDIGKNDIYKEGIKCLHLFKTINYGSK